MHLWNTYDQSSKSEQAHEPPKQPLELANSGTVQFVCDVPLRSSADSPGQSGTTKTRKRDLIGKYSNFKTISRYQHQALPTRPKYMQNDRYSPILGAIKS
jgi:hypothetical protein